MWVASFVFDDWSQAKRDALPGHEQIHYLVGALSARDYAKDFEAIAARTYDSSPAGIDDIKPALARNSEANAQALQDAYDGETGRATCRERVCKNVWNSEVAITIKNK